MRMLSYMQLKRYSIREGRLPFMTFFTVGVLAGMIFMNFGKSILLENTGLLDEYTLYHMKYMTVDSSALFVFVLKERLGQLLLLAVASTTYLGLIVCGGMAFWYGICLGGFLAASVIRYGLKGIVLVVVSIFPQYVVYVPALIILLFWCQRLYRLIYLERSELFISRTVLQLLGIGVIFVLGCVLESFFNPILLHGFLKIF